MLGRLKEILKASSKSLMFTYFIIIMIILLPNAIVMPSQSFKSQIITAIGIDGKVDDIEMSVLALSNLSKDNMSETTKVISGKGQTVANAVFSIERQVGRSLKMGHVGYIVLSKSLTDNDITKILNNLIITTKLPDTISLVICEDSAKNVLDSASKLEQTSSYKFREMIQNEYNEDFAQETSLDAFLKGYYSPNSSSSLGYVSLTKNELLGVEVDNSSSEKMNFGSSDESNMSNNSSNENAQNNVIEYSNRQSVFKNGIFQYILSNEETEGLNFIVENNLQKLITINDVNTQGLIDGMITFDILSEKLTVNTKIENNKPQILYNISLKLKVMEVISKNENKIAEDRLVLDDEINSKISEYVKQKIAILIKKMKQEKTDIANIYNYFESSNYSKLMSFMNTLQNKDDYLSYMQIKVNVKSKLSTN